MIYSLDYTQSALMLDEGVISSSDVKVYFLLWRECVRVGTEFTVSITSICDL